MTGIVAQRIANADVLAAQAVALKQQGMSNRKIALELGVSFTTVARWLRDANPCECGAHVRIRELAESRDQWRWKAHRYQRKAEEMLAAAVEDDDTTTQQAAELDDLQRQLDAQIRVNRSLSAELRKRDLIVRRFRAEQQRWKETAA